MCTVKKAGVLFPLSVAPTSIASSLAVRCLRVGETAQGPGKRASRGFGQWIDTTGSAF